MPRPRQTGRLVRQPLPDPPATYDQSYLSKLVSAVNLFMFQVTAPAEITAARFICNSPVIVDPSGTVPDSVPDTSGLPTGTIYFYPVAGATPGQPGALFASIVTRQDL